METETPPKGSAVLSFLYSCFGFFVRLFTGFFKLVGKRFTKNARFKLEEATLYSVHQSFYLWPLIFLGWFIAPIINHFPGAAVDLTWMYIWVVFYTFLMLLFRLGTKKLVMVTGVIFLIVITAKYVEAVRHISMLSAIFAHFRNLRPQASGGVCSVMSWLLFIPWVIMLVEAYRGGRKSFSPNGIEERSLLIGREITDRSGLHFVCHYPNLLKTLLGFGSGSLTACDSTNKVVKEWNDIFMLYFKWDRLDEILHQRSAVVDNSKNDPVEVEDVDGAKK